MNLPDLIRRKTFLVVDDFESMRIMTGEQLKQLGVEKILYSHSGNHAMTVLVQNYGTENEIDCILTDLMMDDGSGLDLVKAVRANSSLKGLPVLMITSKAEVSHVVECVKAGVNHYIIKPWQLEELTKKIILLFAKK